MCGVHDMPLTGHPPEDCPARRWRRRRRRRQPITRYVGSLLLTLPRPLTRS